MSKRRTRTTARPARRNSVAPTDATQWTAIVGINGAVRPTFFIPTDTLKGVRKGRAAVKAALDICGVERISDATDVWLADDSVTANVVVISPDNRVFQWSQRSEFVRLVG